MSVVYRLREVDFRTHRAGNSRDRKMSQKGWETFTNSENTNGQKDYAYKQERY